MLFSCCCDCDPHKERDATRRMRLRECAPATTLGSISCFSLQPLYQVENVMPCLCHGHATAHMLVANTKYVCQTAELRSSFVRSLRKS
jgi:hypothetical protein